MEKAPRAPLLPRLPTTFCIAPRSNSSHRPTARRPAVVRAPATPWDRGMPPQPVVFTVGQGDRVQLVWHGAV